MAEKFWKCNHDDHINKHTEIECEICNNKRPVIKKFSYELLDDYGCIDVFWEVDNSESVQLKYNKSITEVEKISNYKIEKVKNKSNATLILKNITATFEDEIFLILEKPEITSFEIDKLTVLEGEKINILWHTKNALKVSISNIGNVEKSGSSNNIAYHKSYKISASNDVGTTENEIYVNVLPLPKIINFKSSSQKIEFGKDILLKWVTENTKKVELYDSTNKIEVSQIGELKTSPNTDINYKLIVFALDGTTSIESIIK